MSGIIDRIPASLRHFLFSVAAVLALGLLDWAQANYTTWNLPQTMVGIVAMILPVAVAWLTPITQQYGIGSQVLPMPSQDGAQDTGAGA